MQKYDFIKKQYTAYTPPQNGHCDIMVHANEELNCAACGRTINEHNAYTSAAIQNDIGIGYLICKSCYEHELEIRKAVKEGSSRLHKEAAFLLVKICINCYHLALSVVRNCESRYNERVKSERIFAVCTLISRASSTLSSCTLSPS